MIAQIVDLGRMPYLEAWDVQRTIAEEVSDGRREDCLLLVEHPPVLTLGAAHQPENLLFSIEQYQTKGIEVVNTDRGGDVTYHGPGQLVAYPIFNVARHGRDLHRWLRDLEQTVIEVLTGYGLDGRRFPPHTGVWVGERKVAAIGIKVRRWVSLHGIALNCNNDLGPFSEIVPCGIRDYGVTSLSELTGKDVPPNTVKPRLSAAFATVFGLRWDSDQPLKS